MMKDYAVVDFETEGIEARPHYPPRPVGVSIQRKGRKPKYCAWGHPSGNNSSQSEAREILREYWGRIPLIFHNAKFDLEVGIECLGLPELPYNMFEDTMILGFLLDPYAYDYRLKEMAQRDLGMPAEERDELKEWIIANVPEAKQKKSTWGRYICRAPGGLAGRYANGDVERTAKLFELYYKKLDDGMRKAYEREKRLIPILIRNEQRGMAVDRIRLKKDADPKKGKFVLQLAETDRWIHRYLKAPEFNIDAKDELADALEKAGKADGGFLMTPTGKRSTKKESIEQAVTDQLLVAALAYRGALATCIRTFMQPWYGMSEMDGFVHTSWNAIRQEEKGGARTGRLSSMPNLQNIPTEFEKFISLFAESKLFERTGFAPLPSVRSYVVADSKQYVLFGRDYSSQELRVLAHYEDGVLAEAYRANPATDLHRFVAEMIAAMGFPLDPDPKVARKIAKTINFLKVYGGGAAKLAVKIGRSVEDSKRILDAYLSVIPGLKELSQDMKRVEKSREPIRTLGGRLYYAEEPKYIDGKWQTYGYKLLNYLIQGSSADMTKEAMIRYDEHPRRGDTRLLLTVHDELVCVGPKDAWKGGMAALKEAMESIELDVPLLSEGEVGYRWTEMKGTA